MKWKLLSIIDETAVTKTLRFHPEEELAFLPGQFFMFSLMIDGKKQKRAYSAASSPTKDYVEVTVKAGPNPLFAPAMHNVRVDDIVDVDGPFGKFYFEEGSTNHVVLVGAGSGVCPLRSIAHFILDKEIDTKITLLCSAKNKGLSIYHDEFEEIKNRCSIHHTFTESSDGDFEGRVNEAILRKIIPDTKEALFFICGPPEFVNSVASNLLKLGVEQNKMRTEKYN